MFWPSKVSTWCSGAAPTTRWASERRASAIRLSYAWWSAACSKRPSRWACRPAPRSPPRIRRSTSSTWASGTSPSAPTSPCCTSGGSPRVKTCARRSAASPPRGRRQRQSTRGKLFRSVARGLGATLQQRRRFPGHRRALEEAGVLRAPQPHGIAEDEVVEVALGDEPVLDQLERLGQRVAHVDDVEMPDVGAVDRVDPRAERHRLAERHGVHPVIGLAAEIVRRGVEVEPVLLLGDVAVDVVVGRHPAGKEVLLERPAVASVELGGDIAVPVLADQLAQQRTIELGRVHVLHAFGAAPLPVLDQVAEELAAPADATLEEREAEVREPPGHPTEEKRLGHVVAGVGEVADVVEREVGWAVAFAVGAAACMEGRGDAELAALLPQRIVVVLAVDAELIEALGVAGEVGGGALGVRDRPADSAAEHADLRAELSGDELQLLDGLVRGVHPDHRGRGEPVAEVLEVFVSDDVEAADYRAPGRVVGDARDAEPGGGIDDTEVDAELAEPVVEHPRHHGCRAVAGVGRLPAPEPLHGDALLRALLGGHAERIRPTPLRLQEAVGAEIARNLADLLRKDRGILDPVPVAVDDGVRETLADFFGHVVRAHLAPPGSTK